MTEVIQLPMRLRFSPLDANPVFICLGDIIIIIIIIITIIIIALFKLAYNKFQPLAKTTGVGLYIPNIMVKTKPSEIGKQKH